MTTHKPIGPVDATQVPRYAGLGTFARLPQIDRVPDYDIAIVGVPFDGGTSFRPGARFGPAAVREASRLLRPGYHPELDVEPVYEAQVVDAGDIACTPYDITRAVREIEEQARPLISEDKRLIAIGGLSCDPFAGRDTGRLRRVYVARASRGQNVGKALVQHLLEFASEHFRVVRLSTDTPEGAAFYLRCGFQPIQDDFATHMKSLAF